MFGARHARVRAAAKRRSRAERTPRQPRSAILVYTQELGAWVGDMHARARAEMGPMGVRFDAPTRMPTLTFRLAYEEGDMAVPAMVGRAGERTVDFSRREAARVMGISFSDLPEAFHLPSWRAENVAKIKTLSDDEIDRVNTVLTAATATGARVEDIAAQIEHEFEVTESYAGLLARDQVLKLNGQVQREMQSAAGVTEYIWMGVGDGRERPMHRALNGSRQSWNAPPVVSEDGRREHPGGDYQCRCQAVPVM